MRIGINVWSFPHSVSMEEAMARAARIGYEGFEPALTAEDLVLGHSEFREKWRWVRLAASDMGLEVPSVATGLYWRANPLLPGMVSEALRVAEKQVEAAYIAEARVMLVVPGRAPPEPSYDSLLKRASEFLRQVSRIAWSHGIVVGVENVWNGMLASPIEMRRLLEEAGDGNLGVYLDVGNTLPHSLPEHWIDVLGDLVVQVHAKDYESDAGRFGIPLTGDVNWSLVASRLRETGYSGYVVAEVPPYKGDPFKAAEDTYTSLTRILRGERWRSSP